MNTENTKRPRRNWIFRIAIAFAVLLLVVLFWPPRWWPSFEPMAPGWEWLFPLAIGPVIPAHIDVDGNRITPTFFRTEPNFFDTVEAELARRGGRPFLHRHATDNEGRALLTRVDAAMLAGWFPGGEGWRLPEDIDPFAEGPVPFPADLEIVFFNRDGSVAFLIELEEGATGPPFYRGGFHEGLAPVPTRTAEPNTEYSVIVQGDDSSWSPAMEPTNFGFVTTTGEWAIPPQFDDARRFHEGLAAVSRDGDWGYINADGEFAIDPRWKVAQSFSEGLAAVHEVGTGWGYINPEGAWVIEPQFQSAGNFSDGLAAVSTRASDGERVYGYIDLQGEWVLEPQFHSAGSFNSERAAVNLQGAPQKLFPASGYIDRSGEMVLPGPFVIATNFHDGEAMVAQRVTPARWLLALFRARVLGRPQWEL